MLAEVAVQVFDERGSNPSFWEVVLSVKIHELPTDSL